MPSLEALARRRTRDRR